MNTLVSAPKAETAKPVPGKYLAFVLGGESYAIGVMHVREIIRPLDVTPVPRMPAYIQGVVNLRGKVVAIFDLRIKFGLPMPESLDRACVIVVQAHSSSGATTQIGLIVDTVEEVVALGAEQLDDTPSFGASLGTEYLTGMARIGSTVKMLLNIDRILEDESGPAAGSFGL